MSDRAHASGATSDLFGKGKGKAPDDQEDVSMGEDNDGSSEEDELEDDIEIDHEAEQDDEDNMEEIDLNNIVEGGRRTRGKVIDFARAAEEAKDIPADDEEEDEDGDYEAPVDRDEDAMEH